MAPGELVLVDETGVEATQAVPQAGAGALCLFEFIYLARPDSTLAGIEVHAARVKMGERLADEAPVDADLVMPAPDSGTPAAIGFSRASGIPFSEGLIKNRYVGRTFIEPDHALREQGIRLKFNPLSEVAGKRVVLVDDSIVRGNTMRKIVELLFDAGAQEVHVRISSPPIVSPCFYGIDFADEEQLVAASRTVAEVQEQIGATSLAYISLEGVQAATMRPENEFCRACFTRTYPTRVPAGKTLAKFRFEPSRRRRNLLASRGVMTARRLLVLLALAASVLAVQSASASNSPNMRIDYSLIDTIRGPNALGHRVLGQHRGRGQLRRLSGLRHGHAPAARPNYLCRGPQNDVSLWPAATDGLLPSSRSTRRRRTAPRFAARTDERHDRVRSGLLRGDPHLRPHEPVGAGLHQGRSTRDVARTRTRSSRTSRTTAAALRLVVSGEHGAELPVAAREDLDRRRPARRTRRRRA